MSLVFDSLGFAKHLRESGVDQRQSEAHAEAVRDYIVPELATKSDVTELRHLIERQGLLITVRLGGLLVIGIGALAALIRLT